MSDYRPGGDGAGRELRVELHADLGALREEWTALAERADSVFASWEWASAWWRHLGGDRPLHLATCRSSDGRLVAIVPLFTASTRPLRVVRLIGVGPGDELGPVCAPEDRPAVAPAVRTALDMIHPRWDVFVADLLPRDAAWASLSGVGIDAMPNPIVEIGGMSWDDFMASRSAKFRQQLRRNTRRLVRDHGLEYRLADDPERLDADLDALFSLHGARWGKQSSGVFAGAEGALHRDFAHAAMERGWLRLWFLHLDGRPAAARLGFRFGRVESGYQCGRETAWEKYGIGFLLQAHTIEEAMNDGMEEYRLLRGGESYKDRLANADRGLETIALARGPAGRAALAAGRAALALPPSKRAWLSKLAGSR